MAVATEREYGLFINGESTESSSGELRDLVEPATGEPLTKAAIASENDVERAVDAARAAGFGHELGLETLDAYLDTRSVIVSTSPKPFNPFGL